MHQESFFVFVIGVKDFIGKQQNLSDQVFPSLWGVLQKRVAEVHGYQGGGLCCSLERHGEPTLRKPDFAEMENMAEESSCALREASSTF